MNRRIVRLATLTLVLFGALFVNLNVITLLLADDLVNHPANRRVIVREYGIERGPIVVGDQAVAFSEPTEGELRYRRRYPEGPAFAHLTGYYSIVLQRSGLEAALNEELTGRPTEVVAQNLGELLGGRDRPGNAVELTIDPRAQAAAIAALDGRTGAVVAVDPTNGAVLASVSNPSFDPEPLSSHDRREIAAAWDALRDDPAQPLIDRTRQELYPPGSTFKLITAAAALELGLQPDTRFPDERVFDVPQTSADIGNLGGGFCGDGIEVTLTEAFAASCNTVFARLGVELGAEALVDQAERFGFGRPVPFELDVVASRIPPASQLDVPATAQSALGQRDVRATPLQMALVAASVANGGQLYAPHVLGRVRDPDGLQLAGPDIRPWRDGALTGAPVSARTAQLLREMMITAVESGTGRAARIDGVTVGGKTGTAQTGDGPPVAWFVGFAGDRVAVAVVLPDSGDDATGGRLAAPIAREVMAATFGP